MSKYDWTTGDWLDGPGFVDWVQQTFALVPEPNQTQPVHTNQIRGFYRWKFETMHLTVWQADAVLTKLGGHLSDIPDRLWIDPPKKDHRGIPYPGEFRNKIVKLYRDDPRPGTECAKEIGMNASTFRHWLKDAA